MKGFFGQRQEGNFFYLPLNFISYTLEHNDGSESTRICWSSMTISRLVHLLENEDLSIDKLKQKKWEIFEIEIPDYLVNQFKAYKSSNDFRTFDCALEIIDYAEVRLVEQGLIFYEEDSDDWWKKGGEFKWESDMN